jgi:hypothetical protein
MAMQKQKPTLDFKNEKREQMNELLEQLNKTDIARLKLLLQKEPQHCEHF